jgi:hypothetical protein
MGPVFDAVKRGVDTPRIPFISRPFIGVGGPRKRNPVIAAKSAKRTTPFAIQKKEISV